MELEDVQLELKVFGVVFVINNNNKKHPSSYPGFFLHINLVNSMIGTTFKAYM